MAIDKVVLRRPLEEGEITVVGATGMAIGTSRSHESITGPELRDRLNDVPRGTYDVVLCNVRSVDGARAEDRVSVQVEIPRAEDLDTADDAFLKHLGVEDLQERDLERFDTSTHGLPTGNDYASALYDYASSIRLSDHSDFGRRDLQGAKSIEQRSLGVLRDFPDRPVACVVAGFSRFALNDLRRWNPCGAPQLDECCSVLSQLAGDPHDHEANRDGHDHLDGVCPSKRSSAKILELWRSHATSDLFEISRVSDGRAEDAVKAAALALAGADNGLDPEARAKAARAIRHDPIFGGWAENTLA